MNCKSAMKNESSSAEGGRSEHNDSGPLQKEPPKAPLNGRLGTSHLRWGRCLVVGALLAASLSVSGLASGDEVDTLFEQGTTHLEKGEYPAAYEKLSAAFEKRKSVDIAANLALAEVKTGKKREAAEHLAYGLANFPATGDPKAKDRMQAQLNELKKGLCEFRVNAEQGSTVFVGNVAVGLAPLQTPLYLNPGSTTIRVELSGKAGEKSITAAAGDSLTIKVELTTTVGPAPTATATPTTTTTAPPPPDEKPIWPAILLGSLAGVGAGVGVGLTVVGTGKYGSAQDARDACVTVDQACENAVSDEFSGANGLLTGGIIGLSVAGASLAAMVIYLVIPGGSDEPAKDQKALLIPVVGPDQAGAQFNLRF